MTVTNVEYERFMTAVQQQADLSRERAERAIQATLETLAERLSAGEARDRRRASPWSSGAGLHTTGGPEPFHVDEFLRRVAAREGTDLETAEHDARACEHTAAPFETLREAFLHEEFLDVTAQLPLEYTAVGALPQRP